jgi:hypothetical protein
MSGSAELCTVSHAGLSRMTPALQYVRKKQRSERVQHEENDSLAWNCPHEINGFSREQHNGVRFAVVLVRASDRAHLVLSQEAEVAEGVTEAHLPVMVDFDDRADEDGNRKLDRSTPTRLHKADDRIGREIGCLDLVMI